MLTEKAECGQLNHAHVTKNI